MATRKKDNLFSRAKAYVVDHPRTTYQEAIQKLSGKKVSGTKKVSGVKKSVGKVTGKPKVAGTRKRIAGGARVASTNGQKSTLGRLTGIPKAEALLRDIDRLERKRAKVTHKELRDIIQLEINSKHHALNGIKNSYRHGK